MQNPALSTLTIACLGGLACAPAGDEGPSKNPSGPDASPSPLADAAAQSEPDAGSEPQPDLDASRGGQGYEGAEGFAGGFSPENAPYGGFGGGDCESDRVPIVFIHGNGDEAASWDSPASTGGPSVYGTFRRAGYNPCELFGIDWLSDNERSLPQLNYHEPAKADIVGDFIADVLAYTGADEVDIVAHSMGVSVSMHAFERDDRWPSVRRFASLNGPLRGLEVCNATGYANAAFPVCGSQNIYDSDVFGFYPDAWYAPNPRMGKGGFRDEPSPLDDVSFYSIRAGKHDQILCATAGFVPGCETSALFEDSSNVRAQLDIGHGSTAVDLDVDLTSWTIYNLDGGDLDGVGHFRTRQNAGPILESMLTTSCTGSECCGGYDAPCSR